MFFNSLYDSDEDEDYNAAMSRRSQANSNRVGRRRRNSLTASLTDVDEGGGGGGGGGGMEKISIALEGFAFEDEDEDGDEDESARSPRGMSDGYSVASDPHARTSLSSSAHASLGGARRGGRRANKASKLLGMDDQHLDDEYSVASDPHRASSLSMSSHASLGSAPRRGGRRPNKASKLLGMDDQQEMGGGGGGGDNNNGVAAHHEQPSQPPTRRGKHGNKASKLLGMDNGDLPRACSDIGPNSGGGGGDDDPNAGPGHRPSGAAARRVSFKGNDKASKLLGLDNPYPVGGIGLPTTSETSEASGGSHDRGHNGHRLRGFISNRGESFGSGSNHGDGDESSVVTFEGSVDFTGRKKKFRGTRKAASRLIRSVRKGPHDVDGVPVGGFHAPLPRSETLPTPFVHFSESTEGGGREGGGEDGPQKQRRSVVRNVSARWGNNGGVKGRDGGHRLNRSWGAESLEDCSDDDDDNFLHEGEELDGVGEMRGSSGRKSMTIRRDNIDAKSLNLGLDQDSANFLDWMSQAKCQEWLKSLSRCDPRFSIKAFFDDVARDGADTIEQEGGFQPELLSPLLSMFQRSSVFSVWRPTSIDSIRKMMTGQGTGKGLDIKGKSAKKGKLSAYVPFLQIHEDEHKTKIRSLTRDGRIRIFYKKREMRDNAQRILEEVVADMKEKSDVALRALLESEKEQEGGPKSIGQDEDVVGRVLSSFRSLGIKGNISDEDRAHVKVVNEWSMDNPSMIVIDDYAPTCFGLDLPKRLFWEGYVMRADDISRPQGSVYDTGRPSRASFQDMNFASIKNTADEDMPRAVVWQFTDPYLPPTEPDPDPMMPQTLLMAYEEHGRVMPVVSDFDCFLLGTRGVRFHSPLPEEQVELVHSMLNDTEKILDDSRDGKTSNWTASWLDAMKHHKKPVQMPKYGYGDPKSTAIISHAVKRLEEFGAVRHGAECFNFYFPQELDDEFLVIGGMFEGAKYKYMKLKELQEFLSGCIDLGFTFPLNPKWVLCDEGWKALWEKLTGSTHPNVQLSINAWYPPGSGLKERIEEISAKNPDLFQSDLSGRKKGTQAWDEAEIALDRYQRIQRAKRKLWVVLCWISIVQQSRKKVLARTRESASCTEEEKEYDKRVSFLEPNRAVKRSSVCSEISIETPDTDLLRIASVNLRPSTMDDGRASSVPPLSRTSSLLSESDEHIEVIDSLLNSAMALSDYQTRGLQRLREQMLRQVATQPRINNRFERRHTSVDSRASRIMQEDMPSFILKEYGGCNGGHQGSMTKHFQASVKKIMNAQRLMAVAKAAQASSRKDHFLPVEWTSMSLELRKTLAEKLSFESLSRWDYNIIEVAKLCKGAPLLFVGWAIIGSPHAQQAMAFDLGNEANSDDKGYNFATVFSLQLPILCSFLRTTEANYLENPYHNNTHASDVLQTLNTMLQLGGKDYASSALDIFSILIAAVIHDVQHPGLNNNFQINSRSELAVQYNDVSVLENYSITWFFSKLLGQTRDFTVDILSGLSKDQFARARSTIIRAVLETDMTHHFALLKKMGIHQQMLKDKPKEEWLESYTSEGVNFEPSMDMLCFLLHQADISNPAKPYPLFEVWADRILDECYMQGEKEVSLMLPVSPLCDRETTKKKQSQIGFIKFVVQPSYQLLGEILPLFAKTVFPHIEDSLAFWGSYGTEDQLDLE